MSQPLNIFDTLPRDCWVDIDTAQLAENTRILTAAVERPVLVVVKANGYGHGYENAARAFLRGGAKYLGVVNYSEGVVLRRAGIEAPILIIGGMSSSEMVLAARAGFEFFVGRPDHAEALRQGADKNRPARVHIEIDTGMGRCGVMPEDTPALAQLLKATPGVEIAGIATHFVSADEPSKIAETERQIAVFEKTVAALAAIGIRPPIVHAANSPGALYFPRARYDMVRFGIVAYGVPPDEGLPIPPGVKTALTWRARFVHTKILPAGHGVSYGSQYRMPAAARVGVLPVGYGDGYRRLTGINSVLVEGQERKVFGRVCMDHCMVDLEGFGDITGADAVLIGEQNGRLLGVEELARRWKTNPYEVYCGIAARVPRQVVR